MIEGLLSRLRGLDVRLWVEGGALRYSAPTGVLTDELLGELRAHKDEILGLLGGGVPAAAAIAPAPRDTPPPASFAQERLWLLDQMNAAGTAYNMPLNLRWRGPLDRRALGRALATIVERHETLRTAFGTIDARPVQVIDPPGRAAGYDLLPVSDLTALDPAAREQELERLAVAEIRRPFDLGRAPLFRTRLVRLAEREHVLLHTFHHVVTDAWSMAVYARELSVLYAAFAAGRPSPLPPLAVQYADFAVWQRRHVSGATLDAHLAYWTAQLADLPTLALPTDRPRPPRPSFAGGGVALRVPAAVARALRALGREHGATPFVTLLAAFQALLFRYTGQARVPVGCPGANRHRAEVAECLGVFSNLLVLCTSLEGDPTFVELLRRAREVTLGAQAHEDLPFEKLVEALAPERDFSRHPLFQVWFVMQPLQAMLPAPADGAVEIRPLEVGETSVRWDLELHVWEDGDEIAGVLLYATDLFERPSMERLARHLGRLLAAVAAEPARPVSALPILDDDERRGLIRRGERRARHPVECLHERFTRLASERPDAVAVVGPGDGAGGETVADDLCRLTYGELNARANRLAHRLRALGVGPETRVALVVHRSVAMVVGVLGVLKAGGAYVPVDPAYPDERVAYLLADARPAVVVAEGDVAGRLAEHALPLVVLDDATLRHGPTRDPASGVTADNLAYVIYTSGSTGWPKGVAVSHASVGRLFATTREWLAFEPRDVWSLFHSPAFDFSVWELWGALLHGGRVVVVPYWLSRSPSDFHALLARERVTTLSQTPSAFRQLSAVDAAAPADTLALGHVVFGGEALPFDSLGPWVSRHGDERPRLVNMYGITETTVHVTGRRVRAAEVGGGPSLIGAPLGDLDLHVLDACGGPAPEGVPGELHVGGRGLARGYLRRPGLTADRFVPHPFRDGERLYRSGDVARRRGDDLEYVGRLDAQVQLRGFRVEPGEIEATLRLHLAVADAVVDYRDDGPRGARLVAYAVRAPAADVGPHELRQHLADRLPDYMVPATIVVLDALPLTPHGKLDRATLRRHLQEAREEAPPPEPPRGHDEEMLAALWAGLLEVDRVDRRASFFELGGHSLLAMRLVAQLRDVFGVDVPVRRVLEAPTLAALAPEITAARRRAVAPPIAHVPDGAPRPLSFAQTRLWVIQRLEPGSTAYTIPLAYRLDGPLDVDALERSVRAIVRRHAVLRTRIGEDAGVPVTVVDEAERFGLTVVDVGADAADEAIAAEAARPFDLERQWPLRVTLLRLGDGVHVLLLTLHHIAFDAWSQATLLDELRAGYDGRGAPVAPPLQYADYAAWQRVRVAGDAFAADLAYWKRQLAGLGEARLPLDVQRPARRRPDAAVHGFELTRELTGRLTRLCRERRVTPFMALLAAFAVTLCRHGAGHDVVVGSPIANRGPRTEGLIGLFVNTLVLRVDLSGDPTVEELLARVRGTALDAYAHADLPFERLVEELAPERDLGRNPLFQVSFTLQPAGAAATRWSLGDAAARPVPPGRPTTRFDLELHVWEEDGHLRGALIHALDLFRPETIRGMADRLSRLLEAMTEGPDRRVAALPWLGRAERAALLRRGERRAAYAGACVHERFVAQVSAQPDAIAVVDGARESPAPPLTYRELDAGANRLAHRLRSAGVRADARVALYLERSPAMIIAILGVLKAGGAYVPIDPAYPAARVAELLDDARPAAVVTEEALRATLPAGTAAVVSLDGDAGRLATAPSSPPESAATPASLAYVIYTSGSTGRPKGVAVTHDNVVRLFDSTAGLFGFGPEMVWSLFHSYAFDFSVWELWGALLHGGRVVVVPYWVSRSPAELLELLGRERVTVLSQTPSAFRQLAAAEAATDGGAVRHLTHVVFGGEALDPRALRSWVDRHGDDSPRLANMYGITETTVHVTYRPITRADVADARSLIGAPLPDLDLYVLDALGEPVPEGVAGELHVGGAGLARGYLGRDDLTRERFVAHPFRPGERLYRTGDLARWTADDLEYLGRLDAQVQLRGFRVEPGEIEAALRAHPSVGDAAVLYRDDGPRGPRLVAYAALATPGDGLELRRWLASRLPEHVVPSALVTLDRLPLTPNGKLDRAALLAHDDAGAVPSREPPSSPAEQLLAALWADLLGAAEIDRRANFFEAGGHSLLATRLVSRIRAVFGVELPLRRIFERPVLADLAAAVEESRRGGAERLPPIAPRTMAAGVIHPLALGQRRIWFLDRLEAGAPTFNVPLALRLEGELDETALARSLAAVVERHAILRTRIVVHDDTPGQVVSDEGEIPLRRVGLEGPAGTMAEDECLRREAARPFDLTSEPPIRVTLVTRGPGHHLLLLTLHHVAADGWSLPILLREWSSLYAGFVSGTPPELPALPVQFVDYAAWQREHLTADALADASGYWTARLAGAPSSLALPTDRPRPAVASSRGETLAFDLDVSLARRLRALAAREGATPFMALVAAYAAWLGRQTGQDDLVVGTPIANRTRAEVEPLVGCFVNTLALRLDLSGDPSFLGLLARVRARALEAYDHQDLPFERVVEALAPERRLHQTPLFQTMFDLAPPGPAAFELPGLTASALVPATGTAKFDVSLSMSESDAGLHGVWEFRADLFDAATVARWTRQLTTLLEAAAADPERSLADVALMDADDVARIREASRGAPAAAPPEIVHRSFEARARLAPDAVALSGAGGDLTYAALDARANRLAHRLRSRHGVAPDTVVGILLDRSADLVTAMLATLKAGGAYLPLDPALPAARLAWMLRAGGARTVVTDRPLPPGMDAVAVEPAAAEPAGDPVVDVRPEHLAYVMFTSGSTGEPKGVMVTHGGLASFVASAAEAYAIGSGDRVLQFASPSFDTAGEEIYPCLTRGATLVLRTEAMTRSVAELVAACDAHALSVLDLPTAYWHEVVAELAGGDVPPPSTARLVVIGGERARPEALTRWRAIPGVPRLVNTYGPTETTVVATMAELSRSSAPSAEVPIGRPIPGAATYVVDARGALAAPGTPGEILIGGAGVARGYLGRAALTAAQFVPDRFGPAAGARLYRSGDRARWLEGGELEFLGRLDAQAKIRGYRVEPGEVEAALARLGGVREAVVVVRSDASGDARLVAYVVGEVAALEAAALRRRLAGALPDYMVPASIVLGETLPRTPGGKVDRAALLASGREAAVEAPGYAAPRTSAEEALAALWADVLGVGKVGIDDNFFDLGGHSLALLALQRRLRRELGHDVPVVDLFRFTTVRALAGRLAGGETRDDAAPDDAARRAERRREALRGFRRRAEES